MTKTEIKKASLINFIKYKSDYYYNCVMSDGLQ